MVDTTTAASSSPQSSSSAFKSRLRPRKIRKVSADGNKDNATPTPPINVTSNATASNKNRRSRKTTTAIAAAATTSEMVIPITLGKTLSCAGEVAVAIRHLSAADPLLARVIEVNQPPSFDKCNSPFLALARSILYQQLASNAATAIYNRFVSLCGDEAGVVPDTVLSFSPQQLREIGVSARKASFLHDLASKYSTGILSDASIIDMEDKTLLSMLTTVNGIGPWTVHMFMIFSLHRPDVLPVGDLGVRKGVQLLYGLKQLPLPAQMEQLCETWAPYRSVGACYMWRFVEAKGAEAKAKAKGAEAKGAQAL